MNAFLSAVKMHTSLSFRSKLMETESSREERILQCRIFLTFSGKPHFFKGPQGPTFFRLVNPENLNDETEAEELLRLRWSSSEGILEALLAPGVQRA